MLLEDKKFLSICKEIEAKTGSPIDETKMSMLEQKITQRYEFLGFPNYQAYFGYASVCSEEFSWIMDTASENFSYSFVIRNRWKL